MILVSDRPMSFVANRERHLSTTLWEPFLADKVPVPPVVDTVPYLYEDVCDWATVCRKETSSERARSWLVIYKAPLVLGDRSLTPLSLRLQGFLGKHNLKVFGDWDESLEGAARACQHLTLTSDGNHACWQPALNAIGNIRKLVHATLGGEEAQTTNVDRGLKMHRRIFTKSTAATPALKSALSVADDPVDVTSKVSPNWMVTQKVSISRLVGTEIRPCASAVLSIGDFVDVGVGFDVVVRRDRRKGRSVRVYLYMEHVLQLVAARQVKEMKDCTEELSSITLHGGGANVVAPTPRQHVSAAPTHGT